MLTIYLFLIGFILGLGYISSKWNKKETFVDVPKIKTDMLVKTASTEYAAILSKDIEVIENTQIVGKFEVNDPTGNLLFQLGGIGIELDVKTSNMIVRYDSKNSIQKRISLIQKTGYEYRMLLFPLENYMIILLNQEVVYTGHNKEIGIPAKTIRISIKECTASIGQPIISPYDYPFLSTKQELIQLSNSKNVLNCNGTKAELLDKRMMGDKKSVIWMIQRKDEYYVIQNIVNGLYLGVTDQLILTPEVDKTSRFIILQGKKNIVIIHESGKVIQLDDLRQGMKWIEGIVQKKVNNIGEWINYGSTIHIVNDKKQYLSGNLNYKYDFKGSSGLPAVYADDEGNKELIQWTLESVDEKKRGEYVKEGDSVYVKSNGKYLQIIKGNPTPSGIGMEISLGPDKNRNSKWIMTHRSERNLLFRKGAEVFFYHPKTELYLYNTKNTFIIGGKPKVETIGIDKKNSWFIGGVVSLETKQAPTGNTVDYYRFELDKTYFSNKDKDWKERLAKENEKIKKNLEKYNQLKEEETTIDSGIVKTKENITQIQKTKCPPRRLCLNAVDYSCIPQKKVEVAKKEKEKLYDLVYVKEIKKKHDPRLINTNEVTKCKTLKDFDITTSEYIQKKEYVPKKGAILKIKDVKFSDFPEANDYISIESIPDDKKITDFKISELPGFNELQLKIK
jgi:hypothetical protein